MSLSAEYWCKILERLSGDMREEIMSVKRKFWLNPRHEIYASSA